MLPLLRALTSPSLPTTPSGKTGESQPGANHPADLLSVPSDGVNPFSDVLKKLFSGEPLPPATTMLVAGDGAAPLPATDEGSAPDAPSSAPSGSKKAKAAAAALGAGLATLRLPTPESAPPESATSVRFPVPAQSYAVNASYV